jgi:hypothetical protein
MQVVYAVVEQKAGGSVCAVQEGYQFHVAKLTLRRVKTING